MTISKKRRVLQIAAIVIVSLSSIITAVGMLISRHYSQIIQQKLPAIVATASDGLYRISVDAVHINFITKRITATGVHLRPDSLRIKTLTAEGHPPKILFSLNISSMDISGLKWQQQTPSQEIRFEEINIHQPEIIFFLADSNERKREARHPSSGIKHLFAGAINIYDPAVKIVFGSSPEAASISNKGGLINLTNWNFYPGQSIDLLQIIQHNKYEIDLEHLLFKQPGSLYDFGMDEFHFNSNNELSLDNVFAKPNLNYDAFYAAVKQQREIYEFNVAELKIHQLNWPQLLQKHSLEAASVDMNTAAMSIYLSRLLPAGHTNRLGNYPQHMLQQLAMPVNIPVIKIDGSSFKYAELNEKTKRTGGIDFSEIHGEVSNFTNLPDVVAQKPDCNFRLLGKFMDRSDIAATFNFPLKSADGSFSLSARLMNLNAAQISESAQALAMAEVKSLQIPKMDFEIAGNETASHGHFAILYNNLKIKVQRLDTVTLRMKNRPLVSFIANKILLYSDNPMPNDTVRTADTYVVRDSTHSYIGMIWKNLFAAGVQTAVRKEGMLDIVRKKIANKGKPKKHFFRGLFKRPGKQSDSIKH